MTILFYLLAVTGGLCWASAFGVACILASDSLERRRKAPTFTQHLNRVGER